MTIDFEDHVSTLQSGIVGGAAGLNISYNGALDVLGSLQFAAHIGREVFQS